MGWKQRKAKKKTNSSNINSAVRLDDWFRLNDKIFIQSYWHFNICVFYRAWVPGSRNMSDSCIPPTVQPVVLPVSTNRARTMSGTYRGETKVIIIPYTYPYPTANTMTYLLKPCLFYLSSTMTSNGSIILKVLKQTIGCVASTISFESDVQSQSCKRKHWIVNYCV